MKIFKSEIKDGIGELIKSTASVAYCSEACSVEHVDKIIPNQEILDKVIAENKGQSDLFYLEAVLVSTGWNKNDDVFQPEATWAAKDTPEDKQFNFMHNESDIIGHITGSYVLTRDGKVVSPDDDRPDEFDIITQAVIYNSWMQPENRLRMDEIVKEIPRGEWFVSMECLFAGFDYALIDEEGIAKVLSRDEGSAFLTKHLRAYGGTGEYQGHKIGRALSNISFSGKGLVSKPANPRSIILNSKGTASFKTDSKLSIGEVNMSDQSLLEKQLEETKAQLKEAKAEVATVKSQIEESKDKEFATKIEAFEAAATQAKATIEELNEVIKSTQARVAELEDALATSKEALATSEQQVQAMESKEKSNKRKAALIEAGLDEDEVTETLASFDTLDEISFETIVALMKKNSGKPYDKEKEAEAAMPPAMKEAIEKKKKEKEAKASEDSANDALNDVELAEAEINVIHDPADEVAKVQASISEWFENQLNSK
jgi:hypothetical protein